MNRLKKIGFTLAVLLLAAAPAAMAQKAGKSSTGSAGTSGTAVPATAPATPAASTSSTTSSGTTPASSAVADAAFTVPSFQPGSREELAYYLQLNRQETRLSEYRDSDEAVRIKLLQLQYINASRAKSRLQPLGLDILASRVANMQSREAAANRFSGHWNMRGEKPYHRYAFAGGVDHVMENAAAYSSSGTISPGGELDLMRQLHDMFMAERPPADGHRQNVLGKYHTHVGIGFALVGGEFRYYEEYIDRYLEFVQCPAVLRAGEKGTITVRPGRPGYHVYAFMVYYEPFPQAMSPSQINRMGSYPDYTGKTALSVWPHTFKADPSGAVTIPVSFSQRGLYYLQVYLDTKPYPGSGSMTTEGKIQASGVVIRVE